ncbi:MAG: lysylphosphatidylglycerol synthase transmembrane domain-containing protein [Thermodesulfobacteriota bacterium]
MTRRTGLFIRVAVGGALFLAVALNIDLARLKGMVAGIRFHYMALAAVALLANRLLVYYRLKRLLDTKGIIVPYADMVKLYWICDFGSLFVPGSVGADLLKILGLKHYLKDAHKAAASVIMELFLGTFSLVTIAFASLLICDSDALSRRFFLAFLFAGGACVAAGAALLIFPEPVRRAAARLPSRKITVWISHLVDAILAFSGFKKLLVFLFLLCLIIHSLRVLMVYLVSLALGLDIALSHVFLLFPLVLFAITLPISIGGLGVRETAFIYLFSLVGVNATAAFTLSLISSLVPLFIKLWGGLIYIREGFWINRRET